ncbi:DUF4998 domain-containing protein [Proteiniphilum sp. UBA5384]|uniref:DUF4998 domain-containing protein n=1 Tax=Proteiniphilum sp. UBA5384 TaxID=1947279 RepID=UPI0025E8914F|nr:DUF4998 domain-containing protein [Proteiniphilum sp. UBA5384]
MKRYICIIPFLVGLYFVSCDNANDLLNQYIKDGPIIYAAKVDTLETQSGYNRFRVNIYPAEDVNRSHCILSWNISEGVKDSVRIDYIQDNYDNERKCYYYLIEFPSDSEIQGNVPIMAQNVDNFGNKSLIVDGSAYVYGLKYTSFLVNAPINISPQVDKVTFEERIGMLGNIISYEQNNGAFTEEVYTTERSFPLVDAKRGGIVRTKTKYLINETDIDILEVADFTETTIPTNEGIDVMLQLNSTSPFVLDEERLQLLKKIEILSDEFNNPSYFGQYLNSSEEAAIDMEYSSPLLFCYRNAFDKVIDEVKNTQVESGSVAIWLLYNMGFIVKTPSGAFGVDVDHRLASQLEPYLDFICVTHNHVDHANVKLMDAMNSKGKPVLSNFYTKSAQFYSKVPANYTIGNFTIKTDITDHLRDPALPDFVTVFKIDCGPDAGHFTMLNCGDSGFNPIHFTNVEGPIDLAVFRWGAARENDILGTGSGQVQTDYIVLSHLIEQRHKPYPEGQASITQTLKHLPGVKCDNTVIPFWGEKMIWKNGQMS